MNNEELLRLTQPMDIFFTSGANCNLWTWFNRSTGAGRWTGDRSIPTHCGFVTHDYGQVMATELAAHGIQEDSLLKYLRAARGDRLIAIYRWNGFDNADTREHALGRLAYIRQQDYGYDWRGAIGLALPWLRGNERREYCSENVFTVLRRYGLSNYPAEWDNRAPHPWPLMRRMQPSGIVPHDFSLIKTIAWE